MRAHISSAAARPLALLYGLEAGTPDGGTMRALLRAMGIDARDVAPAALSQTIGALAGLGGRTAKPYTGAAPDDKMIVFHAFSEPQLDSLLAAMRAAKLSIPYKAVSTPYNQGWSALELLAELKKEHAAARG